MGLDMCIFVESKSHDKWEYVKVDVLEDLGRWDAFYAAMGGVHNYPEYKFAPLTHLRGCPDGLSDYVKEKYELYYDPEYDFLCTSWATLQEVIGYDWPMDRLKNFFNEDLLPVLSSLGNPDNVRLVFWFI